MLLPMLLVAAGLGLVAYGVAAQRVLATRDAADRAGGGGGLGNGGLGGGGLGDGAGGDAPDRTAGLGLVYRALEPVLDAGARVVRALSPVRRLDLARDRILYAGLEGSLTVERLLSYKAVAAVLGLLLGLLGGPLPTVLWAPALAVAAAFVPDVLLSSRATKRQEELARSLPEALDLLALTVEAGLGFEQALEVVADNTTGALAGELRRMLREIELGVSRRDALTALRDRTDVPELSSFVVALVQSDQMGIALGDVLKTQAAQVRLRRRQHAKERAAKTPVKILFPVVLGIFPALFVVTVGPGALRIAETIL